MPSVHFSRSTMNVSSPLGSAVDEVFRRAVPLFFGMLIGNQPNRSTSAYVQKHPEADHGIGAAADVPGGGIFSAAYALCEVPSNNLIAGPSYARTAP